MSALAGATVPCARQPTCPGGERLAFVGDPEGNIVTLAVQSASAAEAS